MPAWYLVLAHLTSRASPQPMVTDRTALSRSRSSSAPVRRLCTGPTTQPEAAAMRGHETSVLIDGLGLNQVGPSGCTPGLAPPEPPPHLEARVLTSGPRCPTQRPNPSGAANTGPKPELAGVYPPSPRKIQNSPRPASTQAAVKPRLPASSADFPHCPLPGSNFPSPAHGLVPAPPSRPTPDPGPASLSGCGPGHPFKPLAGPPA
jgi:hypothetical protein